MHKQGHRSIALHTGRIRGLALAKLDAKHLLRLGEGFGIDEDGVLALAAVLEKRLSSAVSAVEKSRVGSAKLKQKLAEEMEKRWNGTFALIGRRLSKK